jgi:hypothetical protein
MESNGEWQTCVANEAYEICTEYPYQVRNHETKNILKEYLSNGYPSVGLGGRTHNKHRIIGLQFIPNPNNLPQVDHINHDRVDNRIDNLRWCTSSENKFNKGGHFGYKYEFSMNYLFLVNNSFFIKAMT